MRTARASVIAALLPGLCCLWPAAGRAQEIEAGSPEVRSGGGEPELVNFGDVLRVGFRLNLGMGGEMEVDTHTRVVVPGLPIDISNDSDDDGMEVTAGFTFSGEVSVLRYFHLGLLIGFSWFQTDLMEDNNIDRNTWIDFAPVLKGRYPLLDGALEIYAQLLLGLAVMVPSDDVEDDLGVDIDAGAGWTVGLQFGACYRVWDQLDAFLELGWIGHGGENEFGSTTTVAGARVRTTGDAEYETHQFALNMGVHYSLSL